MAVLLEQGIEGLLLSNRKLSRLDSGVIDTQKRVHIVHRLGADIRELLDLVGSVLDLDKQQSEWWANGRESV